MVSLYKAEDMPPSASPTNFSKLLKGLEGGDRTCISATDKEVKVTVTVAETGTEMEKEQWSKESCTTPTATECRIPELLTCPPAPRKRRASSFSRLPSVRVIEYFVPPNLESTFVLDKVSKVK